MINRCFPLLLLLHAILVLSSPNPQATVTITEGPMIPSTAPQFTNTDLFTSVILNSTNFFRGQHNASDVVYNETLAGFATDYLANDTDCTFAHSGGSHGENIVIGCSDAAGCVDLWGDEGAEYDYNVWIKFA